MLIKNKDQNNQSSLIIKNESTLYTRWLYFCHHNQFSNFYKLKGIEAGQLNICEGPDFQGAEFELNGKVYRGDVEIHIKSSDWFAHGHHLDNRYDRVVLHLVWQDSPPEVKNSKNQVIPSVSLKSLPFSNEKEKYNPNCFLNNSNKSCSNNQIKNLALQRLLIRSKEINKQISDLGIEQTLYRLMLISLGNTKNRENFERISTLLPWQFIKYKKEKYNPPIEYWLALFYGVSGLLSINNDKTINSFWEKIYPEINGKILKNEQWKYGGIRPNNHPQIRLSGLANYIYQMKESSLFENISNIFIDRLDYSITMKRLFTGLSQNSSSYLLQKKSPFHSFWGRNLIVEITGNVFVPFLYILAKEKSSFGFAEYLKQFYFYLPATGNYGRLKQFNNRKIKNKIEGKFFYLNQALLHTQNNYCNLYKCEFCPLRTVQ